MHTSDALTAIGGLGAFAAAVILAAIAVYQARQSRRQATAMVEQADIMREATRSQAASTDRVHLQTAEATAWLVYVNRLTWQRYFHLVASVGLIGYALRARRGDRHRDVSLILGLLSATTASTVVRKEQSLQRPAIAQDVGQRSTVWHAIARETESEFLAKLAGNSSMFAAVTGHRRGET